ncbi:hypothetical protein [Parasulfitobacter algicola]|uniref:Uncharacterized protein n=1 Tax=Parasulfitobacter algicola TaxID=2614809 RepID=A0ABX2IVS9_9RHOB|nr:hypothetical protein [Sulfitobacter algicola]NSX56610.1 hypothetical protein [Sulfitobacter algicola]
MMGFKDNLRIMMVCSFVAIMPAASYALGVCYIPEPPTEAELAKPLQQSADCSFVESTYFAPNIGEPAVDLGAGRTLQIVKSLRRSDLIVADCRSAEVITIFGKNDGAETCANSVIEPHIKPEGRFDLTRGRDLTRLAILARRNNFDVKLGEAHINMSRPANKQINVFCGCRLHYPNSTLGRAQ